MIFIKLHRTIQIKCLIVISIIHSPIVYRAEAVGFIIDCSLAFIKILKIQA